jgi:molybdenum cofactor cytidylyltransferase
MSTDALLSPPGDEAVKRNAVRKELGVSVAGIVLAAGRATRMGGSKVLLPIGGRPMVQHVVEASLASKTTQTVLVVGHDAEAVAKTAEAWPVSVTVNRDYAEGMSTSLRAGLLAADPGCDGALFLLGDQPFVTSALLDALIEEFARSRKAVVRPLVGARPANPVLVRADLFPEILEEYGDVGARRVIERHSGDICLLPVSDQHLCVDIDSPEEYEQERNA